MTMNDNPRPVAKGNRRHNAALVLLGALLLALAVAAGMANWPSPRPLTDRELQARGAWTFEAPRALPPFSLLDHRGKTFDAARLKGRWTLLFFGFTHCPDVCPATMSQLAQLMKKLEGRPEADTQVVMVTVDPTRDDAEQLARYMPLFDPNFVGVTGPPMALRDFAGVMQAGYRTMPGQEPHRYHVDHSANLALINPRGEFHGFFAAPLDPAGLEAAYVSIRGAWVRGAWER